MVFNPKSVIFGDWDSLEMMSVRLRTEKLIVSAIFIALAAWAYFYTNELNLQVERSGAAFTPVKTQWDDWIPFVPEFIYPYFLYYPFMLLVIPIAASRLQFYHVVISFAILETFANITFILFPTKVIRPSIEVTNFTMQMVEFIYRLDVGYNLLPSLHVGHSVLVAIFFYLYQRKWFYWVLGMAFMISISTVLVKQHYAIDIPAGVAYAFMSYQLSKFIVYRINRKWALG